MNVKKYLEREKMSKFNIDILDLKKVLMLIEDNLHTSASRIGLESRGKNLREAEKELLFMLHLTKEEAEDIYWNEFVK